MRARPPATPFQGLGRGWAGPTQDLSPTPSKDASPLTSSRAKVNLGLILQRKKKKKKKKVRRSLRSTPRPAAPAPLPWPTSCPPPPRALAGMLGRGPPRGGGSGQPGRGPARGQLVHSGGCSTRKVEEAEPEKLFSSAERSCEHATYTRAPPNPVSGERLTASGQSKRSVCLCPRRWETHTHGCAHLLLPGPRLSFRPHLSTLQATPDVDSHS